MSNLLTIGIILTIYLSISIGIGIYGRSKTDSAEDYFVASRKINPWILFWYVSCNKLLSVLLVLQAPVIVQDGDSMES